MCVSSDLNAPRVLSTRKSWSAAPEFVIFSCCIYYPSFQVQSDYSISFIMFQITLKHLSIATRILLSRLTRPGTIDTAIMMPIPVDPSFCINRQLGRFVGAFNIRHDGNPCFVLVGREVPDGDVSHIFVYYINSNYKTIQRPEREVLNPFYANIGEPDCVIKVGIINIICDPNPPTYLSTLIECIDRTLGSRLFSMYKPWIKIFVHFPDWIIGEPPTVDLSHCKPNLDRDIIDDILLKTGRDGQVTRESPLEPNMDINMMLSDGHFVGILRCHEPKIINYILFHENQFLDEDHYARIKEFATSNLPGRQMYHHYCTRLKSNRGCSSHMAKLAIQLAVSFQPCVLLPIQENELRLVIQHDSSLGPFVTPNELNESSQTRTPIKTAASNLDVHTRDADSIDMHFGRSSPPVCLDSQSTVIMDEKTWKNDLTIWQEVSRKRRRINDDVIPPLHIIEPFDDLNQRYLQELPSYASALQLMEQIWMRYSPTMLVKGGEDEAEVAGFHFVIISTKLVDNSDCIVVMDDDKGEWILLKPDNAEYMSQSCFEQAKIHLLQKFAFLEGLRGRSMLLTSRFHEGYPRLHLLMSVYVISRLFKYAKMLPLKVIYGEWEFRRYAANICAELQLVNSLHNMEQGLVSSQGYLKEGAIQSLPSPLVVNQSNVVPKDQCMFCKKRGFNNLGRHMSMKHGGQALFANRSRLEFD